MRPLPGPSSLRLLERLGVALLLATALLPRARDFAAPFDREVEGWQGAFFAIAAVNYERMGLDSAAGYPVVGVDTMRPVSGTHLRIPREHWLVYANHPPLVPLMAWTSLVIFGPEGWQDAWLEDRAPVGIEPVVRLPFLLCHLLLLWALWWAVREARGAGTAMVALAIAAFTPVLVIYGTLANYENPSLLLIALAAGFHVRWVRDGRRADLLAFALCIGAGVAVTWAPLLFLPAFALTTLGRRHMQRGGAELLSGGLAALAAGGGHVLWSRSALGSANQAPASPLERARELIAPMFDGTLPFTDWLAVQADRALEWFTIPLLLAAVLGTLVLLRAASRPAPMGARSPFDLGFPLLLGGALVQLAFYRHTFDAQHSFLMYLAPGVVVLAATAIEASARPLALLRAGIAPVVVLIGSLGLFATLRVGELRHELRARVAAESPLGLPAPEVPLPDVTGRELASLLPAGSLGLYPTDTGLNLAASFYAWRSLWPIGGPEDTAWRSVAERFGLDEAPVFLLLPTNPPPSARAQVDALRSLVSDPESVRTSPDGSWSASPLGR